MHPPSHIDGARVLEWAWSDEPFGAVGAATIHGLALCRYDGAPAVYRLSCSARWECEQDDVYASLAQAKAELPAQYRLAVAVWHSCA